MKNYQKFMLKEAERNLFQKFQYLPKILGFEVKTTSQATLIHCGLLTSMFNIVCDVCIENRETDAFISYVIDFFKSQPFAWWLGGAELSKTFQKTLINRGFLEENEEHVMVRALRLSSFVSGSEYHIVRVNCGALLQNFITVLQTIDSRIDTFYERLSEFSERHPFHLFVGFHHDIPAVVGSLFFTENCAGILIW